MSKWPEIFEYKSPLFHGLMTAVTAQKIFEEWCDKHLNVGYISCDGGNGKYPNSMINYSPIDGIDTHRIYYYTEPIEVIDGCDHETKGHRIEMVEDVPRLVHFRYDYCPKCGTKLSEGVSDG